VRGSTTATLSASNGTLHRLFIDKEEIMKVRIGGNGRESEQVGGVTTQQQFCATAQKRFA